MKRSHGSLKKSTLALVCCGLVVFSLACSVVSVNRADQDAAAPTSTVEAQRTEAIIEEPGGEAGIDALHVEYVYTSNLITILYPLYGSTLDDFVVVTLENSGVEPVKMIVESEVSGYTDKAIDTVTVDAGETLEVRQNPRLQASAIDDLNSQKPAQFYIRVAALVDGDEKLILEETGDTLVYARRDFPWSIPGFDEDEVFELTAAMVTPNDPAVEELIRKAAEYTDSGMMWGGYGEDEADQDGGVWERLEAIWEAEARDYELTYISTWVSYAPGSVQRIRLPAEVLDQRSGNCIELALLFASAAEALDLETAIIGVPGHAYMAVRTDQVNASYYFIETTMIGQSSFEEAVDYGSEEFDEAAPHLDAKDEYYRWVTIWDAREHGILPLPWH